MANDDSKKQQDLTAAKAAVSTEPRAKQQREAMVKVTSKHRASLSLPPVTHERAKQRGVEIKNEHVERFLDPGENMIPAAHWELVKDQAPVQNWLEEGLLYEGDDRDAPREPSGETARESLMGLPDDEAQRYVDASSNMQQLQQWRASERRPQMRDAITRRLDALNAGK